MRTQNFNPDYVIHPGEYIEELLEAKEMRRQDFAARCGITAKAVSQIINQKSLYSSDLAVNIGRVLGIDASLLMNLSSNYQLFESIQKEQKDYQKKSEWIKKFPEKELIKYKIIPNSDNVYEKADNLLDFFNVSSPDIWYEYYSKKAVSFKESPKYKFSLAATVTWLRIGEKIADDIECKPFNKDKFRQALKEIRNLTIEPTSIFVEKMTNLCRESGVALVFIPELKQTHISGATEWLSPDKALIILSLRHKTNDYFWFTFFHEAAHVLLHSKKQVYIDTKDDNYSENEIEANNFARKQLIDATAYKHFVQSKRFFKDDIRKFAAANRIAPGIIVGMLQHDNLIDYSWHNDLKLKFEFNDDA